MYAPDTENVTPLLARLLYFLLPCPCLACAEPVYAPRGSLGLCPACRGKLVPWPLRGCAVCSRPLPGEVPADHRCGGCRRQPPPHARLVSGWSYQPPLDAVLTGLKFRRLEYLGAQLGTRLADHCRAHILRRDDPCDVVVPVPLHWRRLLSRGFDQAEAIARPLAAAFDLPTANALRRRTATPPQSRLERDERRRNLRNAFVVRNPRAVRDRHVLLVDDVVTTGATLHAAALCLRRGGASRITALTVARTPTPEEVELLGGVRVDAVDGNQRSLLDAGWC